MAISGNNDEIASSKIIVSSRNDEAFLIGITNQVYTGIKESIKIKGKKRILIWKEDARSAEKKRE